MMEIQELVNKTKLYLLDMDGTLYLGDRLFPFTKDFLKAIRERGARYLFMTNNSSKSVSAYIQKLEKFGIEATKEDFMTSSQATAYYLKKHHWGKTLYVCGTQSLKEELMGEGFAVSDDIAKTQCIVMGFDTELNFQKLHDVSYLLLTQPELPYIATNPDLVCPTEFGSVPDCGSVCQMICNATGKKPVVIGKPAALMPELAMDKWGVRPEETCVIGDRIYTDVKSGLNARTNTVLVMSGETTYEILEQSPDKPHLVLADVGAFLSVI